MVDIEALNEQLLAVLRSLPGLADNVYDNLVPGKLPQDGPYIRPYVVVFSGIAGDLPGERSLSLLADPTVADWAPQTTVVGPTASSCRQLSQHVVGALTNLQLGTGWLLPDADAFRVAKPINDSQVTPARAFLPLPWRLITT